MSQTPDAYLSALPEDRRAALGAVRSTILEHLPDGYVEEIQYGMIGYVVPLARFPDTYNGQPLSLAALASQKRHMSLYMMGIHDGEDTRFRAAWEATGRKLDMGKACVRFRRLEDVPLEVVGAAIGRVSVDDLIAQHERAHGR